MRTVLTIYGGQAGKISGSAAIELGSAGRGDGAAGAPRQSRDRRAVSIQVARPTRYDERRDTVTDHIRDCPRLRHNRSMPRIDARLATGISDCRQRCGENDETASCYAGLLLSK